MQLDGTWQANTVPDNLCDQAHAPPVVYLQQPLINVRFLQILCCTPTAQGKDLQHPLTAWLKPFLALTAPRHPQLLFPLELCTAGCCMPLHGRQAAPRWGCALQTMATCVENIRLCVSAKGWPYTTAVSKSRTHMDTQY